MTPERWQQIETLYHAARALPPSEWSAYLASSCPNDPELQREVERLLSQPPSHEGFLAGHARDLAAGLVTHQSALVNKTLGGYQLQALIGVGGMGEVYRGRDLKLGRQVAIKVLPHAFTSDPDRLARFDREARTLAALNHPNICAIHGFEHAGDIQFLVLELVTGDTLAERLEAARSQPGGPGLPEHDALHIARQIARALHFAHQRGIVHRDLKPANIKVTADGAVKILDFGLAKATAGDAAGADLEPVPNVTREGTIEGVLLGTPAYMSPEQARGKSVDKRSDIWAFGCVLYEMLTGRAAFHGDTVADTISRVIEREPDWSALPRFTPEPIRRLLVTCLTKDSEKRLQTIDEATIDRVLAESGKTKALRAHWRVMRPVWLASGAVIALAAAAWIFWPAPKPQLQKLVLPAGQVLDGSGGAHIVTITPDGSELAYVAAPRLLYLWPLASNASEATPVPGTEAFRGVRDVEFSPDGKAVAFYAFADRALVWMPVAGGPHLKISDAETPTGIHWGPNNMVLYGQGRDGIWQASVNAQGATRVAEVQEGEQAHGPWLLPDGDHFLFTIARGRSVDRWDSAKIVVQSLSTRKRTELGITGSDVRYLPGMRLLIYARSGSLWAIQFDPHTLTTQGTAVAVLEKVRRGAAAVTGAAQFRTADNGTLVYVNGPADATPPFLEIAIGEDPSGKAKPRKLKAVPDRYETPRLSPDELTVAVGVSPDKGRATIYTVATTGQTTRQPVTSPDSDNRFPVWSHDNRRLAFQSNRGGDLGIWSQPIGGTDAERLTTAGQGEEHVPESWAADGTLLYSITSKGQSTLWTVPARNGKPGKPARFGNQVSRDPMSAVLSHNGKFVAYTRTDDREVTICIENFPSQFKTQCLQPKLADSPKHPRWSPDDTRIFFDPRIPDFASVEVRLRELEFGEPRPVAYHPIMMAPPGARTPYDVTRQGHLVGFIPAGLDVYRNLAPTEILVVRNWFEELKQKTSTSPGSSAR